MHGYLNGPNSLGQKLCILSSLFCNTLFRNYRYILSEYKFRAPKEYDEVLRKAYGGYMRFPHIKDRKGHHDYVVDEK